MAPQSPLIRRLVTFALGVGAAVGTYALVSGGGLGGTTGVNPRSAAAAELPAFDDCEQLRTWYVDEALPKVGPWGLAGPPVMYAMGKEATTGAGVPGTARREGAVGSSGTGTNVQEADVDESDVAKTDGRIVVRVTGGRLVVTDVTGATPRRLSETRLPGATLMRPELLLHGDHVVVVGEEASRRYGGPIFWSQPRVGRGFVPGPVHASRTRVIGIDLGDPALPQVTSDRSVDGGSVSARQYSDGTVRLVVTTDFPPLAFVHPDRDRSPAEATRLNRRIVREAPVDAWLPRTDDGRGADRPLLACQDVRHPVKRSGPGTISVLTFPTDDPAAYRATAITASGDLAYSSARRLYVATTADRSTSVHAFAVDGDRTTYLASGSVGGTVKDRWSFDEHDGHLRVAAAVGAPWAPLENAVVVLDERGDRLVETGRVDGLGPHEQIRSVRWFGDLAVVVTFRQTDPLYTLDLSDPEHPRRTGTLKVPGFSSYLHPVGEDLLLGVGRDATADGADLGAQAVTFDLGDPADVRRTDVLRLGQRNDVAAGTDPRSFTFLPDQHTAVTPVTDWDSGSTRFLAIRVAADGSLTRETSWPTTGDPTELRALPLGGDRVALVGDDVRVVDVP